MSVRHDSGGTWQVRNGGTADPYGSSRFKGKLVSLMQSREQRFAAFASMARRDIERSMLSCLDGPEEWLATPGALIQMRMQMQMQGSGGCHRLGRIVKQQDSFEGVERQLKEQKFFMQQLQESQREQNILQQQLLKLITYGMIGGERASTGPSPVEEDSRGDPGNKVMVDLEVNHDPPVHEMVTESAGTTFNTVITWLQGRVRGKPSKTDSKATSLTLEIDNRLEDDRVGQPGRLVKSIVSRSLTSKSDVPPQRASVSSESNFGHVRKSSSKRQPDTNISSYVILPLRRPLTPSRKDNVCSPPRDYKSCSFQRSFGKSEEPLLSEIDLECELGNDPAHWQSGSQWVAQETVADTGGTHWDRQAHPPSWIPPLLNHVSEVQNIEDSLRRKWLNPEMEEAVHGHRQHDAFSFSNTTSPSNEYANPRSHRADERAGQSSPNGIFEPVKEGGSTKVDEERKANTWLTEMILEAVLDDVGRELGSLCDEFVEHICSCEFLADD